jgi:cytoskeletal protein CcmA (bactofilin family)
MFRRSKSAKPAISTDDADTGVTAEILPDPVDADSAKTLLTLKDAAPMSRPPFAASPATATRSLQSNKREADRRTMVVGRGISIKGVISEAERLVVEGIVDATLIHATELVVSPGGTFKGEVEVEDADIAGLVDGTLVARGSLILRSTGKLVGTARCRRLQVEDGGQITGRLDMITEPRETATNGDDPAF